MSTACRDWALTWGYISRSHQAKSPRLSVPKTTDNMAEVVGAVILGALDMITRGRHDQAVRAAEAATREAKTQAEQAKQRADEAIKQASDAIKRTEEAEKQRKIAVEQATEAQKTARAEATARKNAEEAAAKAKKEAEDAEKARKTAEERWRKGIPPEVAPTDEEVREMRRRYGYIQGLRHIAVAGISGAGKSSFLNSIRGLPNNHPDAARTGVTETTATVARFPDPRHNRCVWYDIPGAGTLSFSDWQYFKDQGLYIFDAIIVLIADRFTKTDIAILTTCKKCTIPTFIVRSKSDQYIRNIRRDMGYESDDGDESYRRSAPFVRAESEARDKFVNATRTNVRDNLERAGLPARDVYIISKSTMMQVVQARNLSTAKIIDERHLLREIKDIVENS